LQGIASLPGVSNIPGLFVPQKPGYAFVPCDYELIFFNVKILYHLLKKKNKMRVIKPLLKGLQKSEKHGHITARPTL